MPLLAGWVSAFPWAPRKEHALREPTYWRSLSEHSGVRGWSLKLCFARVPHRPQQLIADKYRLLRPLAAGGMGAIWVAHQIDLDVEVAIKFHVPGPELTPRAHSRFKQEARVAAKLKSPHVVQIHDFGIDDGVPYIVMELLQGEDLSQRLEREGRASAALALEVMRQAAKGLAVAHHAGIVHRDIKPSNLFLARVGKERVVKLLDFGIAKFAEPDGSRETTTSVGTVLGSPAYMSPEQARGGELDLRTDLWSLAAVLYRMLVGVAPFEGNNSQDVIVKICTEPLRKPSTLVPDLSAEVDAFFEKALARNPEQRFASVEALLAAFERIVPAIPSSPLPLRERHAGRDEPTESVRVSGTPRRAPRSALVAGAVGMLAVGALLWLVSVAVSTRSSAPSSAKEARHRIEATEVATAAIYAADASPQRLVTPTETAGRTRLAAAAASETAPTGPATTAASSPSRPSKPMHHAKTPPATSPAGARKPTSSSQSPSSEKSTSLSKLPSSSEPTFSSKSSAEPAPRTDPVFGLPLPGVEDRSH